MAFACLGCSVEGFSRELRKLYDHEDSLRPRTPAFSRLQEFTSLRTLGLCQGVDAHREVAKRCLAKGHGAQSVDVGGWNVHVVSFDPILHCSHQEKIECKPSTHFFWKVFKHITYTFNYYIHRYSLVYTKLCFFNCLPRFLPSFPTISALGTSRGSACLWCLEENMNSFWPSVKLKHKTEKGKRAEKWSDPQFCGSLIIQSMKNNMT